MMHRWFMLSAVMALGVISPAHAADIAAGKTTALFACVECHGLTGFSYDVYFPSLAGQKELYLTMQLKAFKSGKRKNPEMNLITKLLTATDIANVAAYFASQRCAPESAGK